MQKRLILIAACLSVFFEALDVSVTALALPTLRSAFHARNDQAEWLQTIYVLFYAGFLILGGRLADIKGRKEIYLLGSFLFLIASLGAGFCSHINALIVCRCIQGIGAAFAIPAAISIITNLYASEKEVNKALGIFGSFAAMGFASGLMAGGVVIKFLNWKWIFWMNVPIIAAVIVIGIFFLPSVKLTEKSKNDFPGGILLTAGIIAFTYAVHLSSLQNITEALIAFTGCIILLAGFYYWEKNMRIR